MVLKSYEIDLEKKSKFRPSSAGISLDCQHVFLRDDFSVRIYRTKDVQRCHGTKDVPPVVLNISAPKEPHNEKKLQMFHSASLGRTVCATITDTRCYVHRYLDVQKEKEIRRSSTDNTWKLSCVAVSETTLKDDLIILAIGFQQERDGEDRGKIELYSLWQDDWREFTKIQTMELEDKATRMTDSPKTLTFSLDGATLTCTTQRHNQIYGWQLPTATAMDKIVRICETSRPFTNVSNTLQSSIPGHI